MDVVIVYETHYGQTKAVADAVAEGVREAGSEPVVLSVEDADLDRVAQADLLVVGAPTHVFGMSRPWSRGRAHPIEVGTGGEVEEGVREWLADLPASAGERRAAAFDTRMPSALAGGAARGIAAGLRKHGYALVSEPEGFIVEEAEGPLREGEADRARGWGTTLARGDASA